ncbi:MAG: carbon-nitrogen hydrolase family protein [Phenylobacterium sp.]|uniref:carbon-nitrogen hydrolase family protein n=1 Tax=Phenylobacterium sp. TaxID=1871053 RepID=UPI003918E2AA
MEDCLRIAVAQIPVTTDARANGREIRAAMRAAAGAGARLIQFPEGAASGYPSGAAKAMLAGWAVDWAALREELEEIAALAAELSLWTVVGSSHALTAPNRPHNSLYVISDTGRLVARYDKRLLSFSELADWYAPGAEPLVFEVDGFRFGCALCIEIQFPEIFVEYARLGIDCLLLSSFSRDPMFAIQVQGHAACNAYWIGFAVPAQCGDAASSGLAGPDGRWIAQAPQAATRLLS